MTKVKSKWTLEREVKAEIKKRLKKHGIWFYMPPASVYGKRGIPDFICCINGGLLAIEAKRPDRADRGLSPYQLMHKQNIIKSGGTYRVVYNEETVDALENILEALKLLEIARR